MKKSSGDMLINPGAIFTFTRQRWSCITLQPLVVNLPRSCEHQMYILHTSLESISTLLRTFPIMPAKNTETGRERKSPLV
jgi:hypothetical protein